MSIVPFYWGGSDVSGFFFSTGDIYEEATHHNAVFVGRDENGIPRYAHQRGTAGSFRLDVKGSDKAFNFCYRGEGERLFVFEAPIDLLSFLCLFKKEWQKQSYLALGGVGEKALLRFIRKEAHIMASEIRNRFTDTEMQIARETDLPELLSHLGYQVKRVGRFHTIAEMDSLRIKDRRT